LYFGEQPADQQAASDLLVVLLSHLLLPPQQQANEAQPSLQTILNLFETGAWGASHFDTVALGRKGLDAFSSLQLRERPLAESLPISACKGPLQAHPRVEVADKEAGDHEADN
jgi:hypothetical protein